MRGNVTIDPLAPALAVEDPEITEIRSLKSGQVLDARKFISSVRNDRIVQVRSQIKEAMYGGRPRVACAICGAPVYIVASTSKAFFFRHTAQDGSCPAQTRTGLSEADIRAMKYKGAQESAAHQRLKNLIERSLIADPRFSNIGMELTWKSELDPHSYRRPDVQATFEGLRFAFEAQLSTTFLDVVVRRKLFYRSENALLVWILPYFDPTYRRMTFDDILFNNNSNVIVVDDASTKASEEAGRFHLHCHFRRPIMTNGWSGSDWQRRLVAWDELTVDQPGQRIFAFDVEGAERVLREQHDAALAAERAEADQQLRDTVLRLLCEPDVSDWDARARDWAILKSRLAKRGCPAQGDYGPDNRLSRIASGLMSVMEGRPVGYKFKKLIEVLHLVAEKYPEGAEILIHALQISGHQKTVSEQDKKGLWAKRSAVIEKEILDCNPTYIMKEDMKRLLGFLFPMFADFLLFSKKIS